jgi:hypothetical protein
VAEKLLDRSDIIAILEEVCRERVPQSVAGRPLRDPGLQDRSANGALQDAFVEVMPAPATGLRISVVPRGGKHPLPRPVPGRSRVLSLEGEGYFDAAEAPCEILLMLHPHTFEVGA